MVTLSIVKADTGNFVGYTAVHPAMVAEAEAALGRARGELLIDGQVATCGEDLSLIMTQGHGIDAAPVQRFAWDLFAATTRIAKDLGLYGAGQDILSDAFSGNRR